MAAQGPIWAQNTCIFSFHGRTGNDETMRMPENTLHDFLGPLASGFWPENALNIDIWLYMAAQGPFWAQITYIFSFHGGTGNNETIDIP